MHVSFAVIYVCKMQNASRHTKNIQLSHCCNIINPSFLHINIYIDIDIYEYLRGDPATVGKMSTQDQGTC